MVLDLADLIGVEFLLHIAVATLVRYGQTEVFRGKSGGWQGCDLIAVREEMFIHRDKWEIGVHAYGG